MNTPFPFKAAPDRTRNTAWPAALAFNARKESWVAASGQSFYKIFRRGDDPVCDWLDPGCIDRARREYADMLFLHRRCDRVCRPVRQDHACVVYPLLSGPDMHVMLRLPDTDAAQRTGCLRTAMAILARLHAVADDTPDYPVKDYLRDSYVRPDPSVAQRIAACSRTILIGGFEVRNLRFDRGTGNWFFFDPQHVLQGVREDGVARFVISLLMINWGRKGRLRLWRDFEPSELFSAYAEASARPLDPVLIDHFLRENLAMRRHHAEKALRALDFTRRGAGRLYLNAYFRQMEIWVDNMHFDYERDTRTFYQDDATAQRYDALYTARHGWRGLPSRLVAHREQRSIRAMLTRVPHRAALDIPAGTGKLAGIFAALGTRVVAADISASMLKLARATYARIGYGRVSFTVGDAEDLAEFAAGEFDVVVCLRLMHRVPAELRAVMLGEFARVAPYAIVSYGIETGFHRARRAARASLFGGLRRSLCFCGIRQACGELGHSFEIIGKSWIAPMLSQEMVFLLRSRCAQLPAASKPALATAGAGHREPSAHGPGTEEPR